MRHKFTVDFKTRQTWMTYSQVLEDLRAGANQGGEFSQAGWMIAEPIVERMHEEWAAQARKDGRETRQPVWVAADIDERKLSLYKALLGNETRSMTIQTGWVEIDGFMLYLISRRDVWIDGQVVAHETATQAMAALTLDQAAELDKPGAWFEAHPNDCRLARAIVA